MQSVAGTGCFSETARCFGVSQPTISNAISDLEEELHGKLFRRTRRCVELTSFGLSVIGHIDTIVRLVEEIEHQAERQAQPDGRVVRVAFSPMVDSPRLLGLLESFRSASGNPELVYRELSNSELEHGIANDKLDLICGIRIHDQPTYGRCPVYRERLRYLPQGGSEQDVPSEAITLDEISRRVLILPADVCGLASAIRDLFRQRRLQWDEYPGCPLSYSAIQDWTRQGIGGAILPESKIAGDAHLYPEIVTAEGDSLSITIEAAWLRVNHDPLLKRLTRFLRESTVETT